MEGISMQDSEENILARLAVLKECLEKELDAYDMAKSECEKRSRYDMATEFVIKRNELNRILGLLQNFIASGDVTTIGVPALPKEPPPGLIKSMILRYNHALGCDGYYDQPLVATEGITHAQHYENAERQMRQLYEEVSGHGFYQWKHPDNEEPKQT